MKKQTVERLKSIAIVLLVLSAFILGKQTGLFDQLSELSAGSGTKPVQESGIQTLQAATVPFAAVATGERGIHYGVKNDDVAVGELYTKVSNILGEALGSAGEGIIVRTAEWRNALISPGVYFDYLYPIPISALSRWLGMELLYDSGEMVRRVCMTEGNEGNIRLYYMTGDGIVLCCETAAVFSSLSARISEYLPNGAVFAFEAGEDGAQLEPCTLLYTGTPQNGAVTASNPVGSAVTAEQLLEALTISPYSNESYTETDGTVVFVDSVGYLKLAPNGTVSFYAYAGQSVRDESELDDPGAVIEAARRLLASLTGESDGIERLYCTGMTGDGAAYTVTFSYFVHGIEVRQGGQPAARVVVTEQGITELQVTLRRYYDAGVSVAVLPEPQAAAIARTQPGETELRLAYLVLGADLLAPDWIME